MRISLTKYNIYHRHDYLRTMLGLLYFIGGMEITIIISVGLNDRNEIYLQGAAPLGQVRIEKPAREIGDNFSDRYHCGV